MYINVVKLIKNMKIAHSITITVFAKEEEDKQKIKEKLLGLVPEGIDKEKLKLNEQAATGFSEKKITIYTLTIDKENHITKFLKNILSKLSNEQKNMLSNQIESRIDEECNFYIRLDKEKLYEGECHMTDQGNCYHIKTHLAAFPAKKEKATEIARKIVEELS
jgi:RNA-binding protein